MKISSFRKFALSLAIIFIINLMAFTCAFAAPSGGRTFTADDSLFVSKAFDKQPMTYEAIIYAPTSVSRTGVIFGNYSGSKPCINFEIYSNGKPSLYINTENSELMNTKFEYDIRKEDWVHVVVVHELTSAGGSLFTLYADGQSVATIEKDLPYTCDMTAVCNANQFSLGRDSRSGNAQYFKGAIKKVALYSESLTASQVSNLYSGTTDSTIKTPMLKYNLDNAQNSQSITDISGNGYDVSDEDHAYSFAVVGDTQNIVYYDITNSTNYTSYIYDYIVKNKTTKNIKFCMGMGDVTENDTDEEWSYAVTQVKKLEDAGIPYTVIQGNAPHDTVPQLDKHFAGQNNFKNLDIEYYTEGSIGNYLVRFNVGDTKYMVVCLQYGPDDSMVAWANKVIAENPDRRVIITTHGNIEKSGNYIDQNYSAPPRRPHQDNGRNNGDNLWSKLSSQHENIILVLSGHDPTNYIIKRTDVGIHGNTVTSLLIDPQTADKSNSYETALVAMLYFSKDGKKVSVEYISGYKTLTAQKTDPNAGDVYFNPDKTTFSFTIPEVKTVADVSTTYGTIPGMYSNAQTYPFAVFKTDKTFVGGYEDLGAALKGAKAAGDSGSYNILMRRNATQYTKSSLGGMTGKVTIDLNGYTLEKLAPEYIFNIYRDNNTSSTNPTGVDKQATFTMKNGTLKKCGKNAIACIAYGNNLARNVESTINYENMVFQSAYEGDFLFNAKDKSLSSPDLHFKVNTTFTNCTFDYVNSIDGAVMMNLKNANGDDRTVYHAVINGCTVKANTAVTFDKFAKLDDNKNLRADKVEFNKGSDGNYLTMVLPETATAPSQTENIWISNKTNTSNQYVFYNTSTADGYKTYTFRGYGVITIYGTIPADYYDASTYPIALFRDGEFLGAYAGYHAALTAAKEYTDGSSSDEINDIIDMIFRANCKVTSRYSNTGQILGRINIDLNNYTLTQDYSDYPLFFTQAKYYKGTQRAAFYVYNGKIVLKTPLAEFSAYGNAYQTATGDKAFEVNFNNIKFSYADGSTATEFLGDYNDDATISGRRVKYDFDFTDCEFDFTNAPSITTIMNANDTNKSGVNAEVDVVIKGGKIKLNSADTKILDIASDSSVAFLQNMDDVFTEVVLPSGTEVNEIKAMTYNFDGNTNTFGLWKVAEKYLPDVIGGQNATNASLAQLVNAGYVWVESVAPIFYRPTELLLISSGSIEDFAAWAVLKNRYTNETFICYNVVPKASADAVLNHISTASYPAILLGSWQFAEGDSDYIKLVNAMTDSKQIATVSDSGQTYHNFGANTFDKANDFVFLSDNYFNASKYQIVKDKYSNAYPSKYYPVLCNFTFVYDLGMTHKKTENGHIITVTDTRKDADNIFVFVKEADASNSDAFHTSGMLEKGQSATFEVKNPFSLFIWDEQMQPIADKYTSN